MGKSIQIILLFFVFPVFLFAQEWTLRLSSRVEKDGKGLPGAMIKLYQGAKMVNQMMSNSDGDFMVEVPANGDFMLVVSYGDCNAKKFQISTLGVPEEISSDRFRPSFEIGGVTMAKPLYSIDYSLLSQPLVKVAFIESDRKFDHDENHTEQMLQGLSRIREAEKALIAKQQESCKAGDEALKKKDCELAKQHYEKAVSIIPQDPHEVYPKEQLKKVNDCFTKKQEDLNKQNQEAAAAAAASKAAADKAESDRLAKEKAEADKLATEQAAKTKAEKERLAKEKADADKQATEQAAKENEKQKKVQEEQAKAAAVLAEKEASKKREEEEKSNQQKENKEKEVATEQSKGSPVQEKKTSGKEEKSRQEKQTKTESGKSESASAKEQTKAPSPKEAPKKALVKSQETVNSENKKEKIVPTETKETKQKKKKTKKSNRSIRPRL